jgi:hypothetical protein
MLTPNFEFERSIQHSLKISCQIFILFKKKGYPKEITIFFLITKSAIFYEQIIILHIFANFLQQNQDIFIF